MLLFIADEPTSENEKDGMVQRIKWIDDRFAAESRVILTASFKGNRRRETIVRSKDLTIERLNLFLHFPRILQLALRSTAIYVHSCYHALRILPLYFLGFKIVTDIHGVVPEELEMLGERKLVRLYSAVERIVARRSRALVFVTNAMRQHFVTKYRKIPDSFVVPILTPKTPPPQDENRREDLVIYSGGVQPWQLVDEMLEAAKTAKKSYDYLFLTGDTEILTDMVLRSKIPRAEVRSVPRSEMPSLYARASLGFIIRNDSLVNRVACPTKLVEYLEYGVIPIVKFAKIGDFEEIGYRYISVEEFIENSHRSTSEVECMRQHNRSVGRTLIDRSAEEVTNLVAFCLTESRQK
jgi:glycosyltransferase involved in cell wall biosynthesis